MIADGQDGFKERECVGTRVDSNIAADEEMVEVGVLEHFIEGGKG